MENLSCKKPRECQKPAVRTVASHNTNQPETRINASKETRTNAMKTITAMKSPFAPSYHQLCGHSDAECCDPRNPKIVNANNARHSDRNNNSDRNHQQDCNYQNNQDSQNNQQRNHRYPT
jgi:hypothetical protein